MIFFVFISFILAKNKICICNNQCPAVCSQRFYLQSSNQQFGKIINSLIKNNTEIDLYFYSKYESILFDLNVSYFGDTKICLDALKDSKPALINLIKDELHIKKVQIDPLHRICLPEFQDWQHSISNNSRNSFQSKLINPNSKNIGCPTKSHNLHQYRIY